MSRFLGEIRQLGYVVPDIEAAMEQWSLVMGVGPFFYNPRVPIAGYHYNGEPFEVEHSLASANYGFIQVELSQTRNEAPSMYRDFMQAGNMGLQHVAYWTKEFDADLARMLELGFRVQMEGNVGANGRFAYFDREAHPGTVIELSEVVGPKGRMFEMIREASVGWDGRNPVRPFPSLTEE